VQENRYLLDTNILILGLFGCDFGCDLVGIGLRDWFGLRGNGRIGEVQRANAGGVEREVKVQEDFQQFSSISNRVRIDRSERAEIFDNQESSINGQGIPQ